ncbi:MAG: hypothetical protein HFJ26_02120 [Clostridia bacterium]|nr:hypothetical protein [Clostridia bacterium]
MSKSGIVNVRMVITQEKILSNIDKVQKMINPNSKKQIVQLDEDSYFKDLIESIKTYLIEYPKKKNFPKEVYRAAYGLVEYATNQFEENTKQIEELIRQREKNIILSNDLKDLLTVVENKEEDWKNVVKEAKAKFGEDITDTLSVIGRSKVQTSQNYEDAVKLIQARINNLESNLHIEIDMERIEDRSKALSYIGIEVADALKVIPAPVDNEVTENVAQEATVAETAKVEEPVVTFKEGTGVENINTVQEQVEQEQATYLEETQVEVKPTLWQKIKNSKFAKAIGYIFRLNTMNETQALPEGRGENVN